MQFHVSRFSIVFVASALCVSAQTCYYPNGKSTNALFPCNSTAAVTNCCKETDVCLSNGLCFSPGLNSVVRRGCTDKTWNSTDCPQICLTDAFQTADAVMTPCGEYGVFCCGQDNRARDCCNSGNRTVQLGTGKTLGNGTSTITTITVTGTGATAATGSKTPSQGASCTSKTTAIPLGVLLGCAVIGLAILGTDWWHKRNELRRPGRRKVVMEQSLK